MSRYDWGGTNPAIERLKDSIEPARQKVVDHPLYHQLNTMDAVVTFMAHHVFAAWGPMSLLKSLQHRLTCVEAPWARSRPTGGRRLVNDIVPVEESDEIATGFTGHFEPYLDGMRQAGTDTSCVGAFIDLLRAGRPVPPSIREAGVPEPVTEFMATTWEFIEGAPVHCQAAAFAFGRGDLIPEMFAQVVALNAESGELLTFVGTSRWTAKSARRWPCGCSPNCAAMTTPNERRARRPSTSCSRPGRGCGTASSTRSSSAPAHS